jgi:hypothetical protein
MVAAANRFLSKLRGATGSDVNICHLSYAEVISKALHSESFDSFAPARSASRLAHLYRSCPRGSIRERTVASEAVENIG